MIDIDSFRAKFKELYGSEPRLFSAPGRVNLIGEHTDYNDGFVLPFAIQMRTITAVAPRKDDLFRVTSLTLSESTEFRLTDPVGEKSWSTYIFGMAKSLEEIGYVSQGADLLIDSNIPFGAGLSSSAALEISVGLALASLSAKAIDRRQLALAGQRVEHNFLGLRSGIMDQFASALAEAGKTLLIDCRSFGTRPIPLELGELMFAVCDSKVKHNLASSEYNTRRKECEMGVELLKKRNGKIESLRDATLEDLNWASGEMPDVIFRRARHVITENARVLSAVGALESENFVRLGELMYESHRSLRDDFEVSSPELDVLVDRAREVEGVLGSRMTGGGFGGSTITLLKSASLDSFSSRIRKKYAAEFGHEPAIYNVKASDGAYEVTPKGSSAH